MCKAFLLIAAICLASVFPALAEVNLSSPMPGTTVPTTVHFVASAASNFGLPTSSMIINVDGKTYKFKLMDHSGEQFIYMIEGEMDYVVGEKVYTVRPEDCLYFDARQLHGPQLKKHQKARYLVVFSER